jgi:hypothetical protein
MNSGVITEKLNALISPLRSKIRTALASERDRKAVIFGGIGLLVLVLYIMFQVFSSGGGDLEKRDQTAREELSKIKSLKSEYIESKRRVDGLAGSIKRGNLNLLPAVEKILVDRQIDRGSFSINLRAPIAGDLYEETGVDVEIRGVSLEKAVDVLYKIQSTPAFLKLSNLRLRTRFNDPSLMDVSFRVSTFKLNQES